ncbi:MAG: Acetyltransferase, GNAT family, partial [uncultured Rubrobacteraceae bacterium]
AARGEGYAAGHDQGGSGPPRAVRERPRVRAGRRGGPARAGSPGAAAEGLRPRDLRPPEGQDRVRHGGRRRVYRPVRPVQHRPDRPPRRARHRDRGRGVLGTRLRAGGRRTSAGLRLQAQEPAPRVARGPRREREGYPGLPLVRLRGGGPDAGAHLARRALRGQRDHGRAARRVGRV